MVTKSCFIVLAGFACSIFLVLASCTKTNQSILPKGELTTSDTIVKTRFHAKSGRVISKSYWVLNEKVYIERFQYHKDGRYFVKRFVMPGKKFDGYYRYHTKAGNLRFINFVNRDSLIVPSMSYDQHGCIRTQYFLNVNGKQGISSWYYPNGQLAAELTYHDNRLDSVLVMYNWQGRAVPHGTFTKGYGTILHYDSAGDVKCYEIRKQGKRLDHIKLKGAIDHEEETDKKSR